MRVLFIDNLDSFTFNLVHCLEVGGAEVEVLRNEGVDWPGLGEKMADCDAWAGGARPPPGPTARLPAFIAGHIPMDG
jgi:anthranilate/para-aminobenzoate synthase component II